MNLVPFQKQLDCHQLSYPKWNLGLLRVYSFNHLESLKPMKILARTGAKIFPAYVSKHNSNREKQFILLMIPNEEKWHYLSVKKY